ncbi:MAG TPA: hypothetical protein VIL74_03770 [Pyrinomonadaceae bacterium]|jgi:hypothetical protein
MSKKNSEPDIFLNRFIEEQEYISRFTELLQRKLSLDGYKIYEIIDTLKEYKLLDKTKVLDNSSVYFSSYDSKKLKEFLNYLRELKPIIRFEINKTKKHLSKINKPKGILNVHANSLAGECISYLIEIFKGDSSEKVIETQRGLLKESLSKNEQEEPFFVGNERGTIDELVDYSIDGAFYYISAGKLNHLNNVLYEIEDVEISGRLSRSDTEINPLRQGFITLTTIFDATVFDLMKLALTRDFFNLISLFGKQDKISLDKINRFSSFDEFRNEIIEDQLKTKYLKEILIILNSFGVTLTDKTKGDEFVHLIEMVLRRNIHIHNRGIVDYKYLELNDNGKPRYNLYNLKSGKVATIDLKYWEKVNRICLNCIEQIATWIRTLPK